MNYNDSLLVLIKVAHIDSRGDGLNAVRILGAVPHRRVIRIVVGLGL